MTNDASSKKKPCGHDSSEGPYCCEYAAAAKATHRPMHPDVIDAMLRSRINPPRVGRPTLPVRGVVRDRSSHNGIGTSRGGNGGGNGRNQERVVVSSRLRRS